MKVNRTDRRWFARDSNDHAHTVFGQQRVLDRTVKYWFAPLTVLYMWRVMRVMRGLELYKVYRLALVQTRPVEGGKTIRISKRCSATSWSVTQRRLASYPYPSVLEYCNPWWWTPCTAYCISELGKGAFVTSV